MKFVLVMQIDTVLAFKILLNSVRFAVVIGKV